MDWHYLAQHTGCSTADLSVFPMIWILISRHVIDLDGMRVSINRSWRAIAPQKIPSIRIRTFFSGTGSIALSSEA